MEKMQKTNLIANNLSESTSALTRQIQNAIGYTTVVITLAMLFFFLILPVVSIIAKAFIYEQKFSLEYFQLLFSNSLQTDAIVNSLKIGIVTTLFTTVLSLPLAILTTKLDFKFKAFLSALLLVPMIMPPFVGAIGVQKFFARRGSVNLLLMDLGIISQPVEWLGGENIFWAVVVLEVLHLYPIMYLNLSAAIANIDPSLEEMAKTLGVSRWRRYKDLIWPLARPGYFAGAIIVFIWALTDLGTPLLVGFHETMPVRIFNMVTDVNENPVGFALVFVVILITVSVFLLSRYIVGKTKYEMLARGHVSGAFRKAKWYEAMIAYVMILLVSSVALIPHLSVFLTSISDEWFLSILPESYTLKYYALIFEHKISITGIQNSLWLASLATLLDIVVGLLIAYVIQRKLVPFAGALDSIVMLPLALPGVVIAFGYIVTYTDTFLDPLHNPVPLLVIAYAIRRLPYMVRSASAGLQQTSISLEEASSTFGASKLRTLWSITTPLVGANLIAGALLCFAYAMLDVSDSLILAMKDRFYPVTKAIYALFLEQGTGEYLASALGMVAMMILVACILGSSLILGKKMGEIFRS